MDRETGVREGTRVGDGEGRPEQCGDRKEQGTQSN